MQVKETPYPTALPHSVTIKARAVAICPVEPLIQDLGIIVTEYPVILGFDVAGEIVEVGEGVEDLHVGQRVLGSASG